jgi:electron transfer flavoprotein alpha subunit
MKAIIYLECKDGSPISAALELFGAAQAAGAEVCPVTVAAPEGMLCEDAVVEAVSKKAKEEGADLVLLAATSIGKLACPRIAERLGAGSVNDAIAIAAEDGKLTAVRPVFGGTVRETIEFAVPAAVISIRGGSYDAPEKVPAAEELTAKPGGASAKIAEVIAEAGAAVNLEDASVIVTGGRGMGSEENFRLVEELADALGGVVGATRPAIENGWAGRTHQVGQSGKIVAPDLYIACGVSGATQHVSGMMGSKYIIAVNKDADAPIFSQANLGIVGDVKQILPLMIEEVKKIKG